MAPKITLSEQICRSKRTGEAAEVASLEAQIDTHVFRLYCLTPEEIALVRGATL